jgi:hypothetical protein
MLRRRFPGGRRPLVSRLKRGRRDNGKSKSRLANQRRLSRGRGLPKISIESTIDVNLGADLGSRWRTPKQS